MKFKIITTLVFMGVITASFSQDIWKYNEGTISYVTSHHVYVRFSNTSGIEVGDTLLINQNEVINACLVVIQKSTTSCVCSQLASCSIKRGGHVLAKPKPSKIIPQEAILNDPDTSNEKEIQEIKDPPSDDKQKTKLYEERIRGRISAASYSNLAADKQTRHRLMYRFSVNAQHIDDGKLSFESYLNYRQNFSQRPENPSTQNSFLRVYNLALKYDVDSTLSFTFGRKINHKVSSVGAIDGLQVEKYFGKFYIGAIVGFRPDLVKFDFNPHLFESGAYIGYVGKKNFRQSQSTLGLLEQRNGANIDRRYAYFQHSGSVGKKLHIFTSAELDLYTKINDQTSNPFKLTNLYALARFKFSRKVNVSLSYDSRRRIIFYETLKTDVERLLDDDEARQGIRARLNIRPFKFVFVGLSAAKRFQSSLQNSSENVNGFVSLSRLPLTNGRLSVHFNLNSTNYLESQILSFRYGQNLFESKVNIDLYYRNVYYTYTTFGNKTKQAFYGAGISYRINKHWMIYVLGEIASQNGLNNKRMNTRLVKRFGK